MNNFLLSKVSIWLLLLLVTAGCATGPVDYPRIYTESITDTGDTRLGREVAKWEQRHGGLSGFYPLRNGTDAFGARLVLIDRAERAIDAQYFLAKPDSAGFVFAVKLLEAADRGVRVRFLLDDVFTSVEDRTLILLDEHPNIEVRLFNPVGRRGIYYLNYLFDFNRANRRMHNKSFTVDNQVTVFGGRNIADEYFDLKTETEFRDFDMLAIGSVAGDISKTFDLYWNHQFSVPMEAFENPDGTEDLASTRAGISGDKLATATTIYQRSVNSPLVQDLIDDRVAAFPATGEVITDDPEKLLNKVSQDHQILATRMAEVVASAESEVVVVTPYFIPGDSGLEFWRRVLDKGVRVVILTNSLASTNHVAVHAGYARYRQDLIQAGVELYELKVSAAEAANSREESNFDSITLHTKAAMVDRRFSFIGSLNLDPRSIDINTEMGVLIDSPDLARTLAEPFFEWLPRASYRVEIDEHGKLIWRGITGEREVIEKGEPQAGAWRRFKAFLSRILPESQL
jgi:putative cardiolipin synthase